ncbi:MAG: phosphoribosyl 1,2-cyclic phosphodiesterase [Candidatus Latescibacterota bacterium]
MQKENFKKGAIVKVKLWGARGTIAIPRPETRRYGVNTPCVQVDAADAEPLILDGGMGLHWLGDALGKGIFGKGQGRAHLLISHTHWSHIQGIPFCMPMLVPGNSFTIHGRGGQRSIRELLLDQMQPTYCPVPNFFCAQIGAQVSVQELADAPLILGPLHIEHAELGSAHDGPCTAYRISDGQSTLAYMPAVEYMDAAVQDRAIKLARNADLLIHDAHYSDEEYETKCGRGHSSPRHAVDTALRAKARRLVLFNHHPERTDTEIDTIAATYTSDTLLVEAAREGCEYNLKED